jgi:hypothetical protein
LDDTGIDSGFMQLARRLGNDLATVRDDQDAPAVLRGRGVDRGGNDGLA